MTAEEDAQRLVRLLWREHVPAGNRRGPRQRLSVDDLVAEAIAQADRNGLSALSVRTVSAALGVRPMSFYTYVPTKDALVSLMVDSVAGEDGPFDSGLPLRGRLALIAEAIRDELIRHPWLLEISAWREVTGPHRLRRYERQLEQLLDVGLSDLDSDRVITLLTAFAVGSARDTVDAGRATADTGLTDGAWWDAVGPVLAEVTPADDFPLSGRVGSVVGELYQAPGDPDGTFVFGLERVLDGIERYLDPQR